MFQNALIPDNIEGLLPVCINEILCQRLPFRAKVNDHRLRGINTYFTCGVGPLVSALDMIVRFESVLPSTKQQVDVEGSVITMQDFTIDVKHIWELLSQAVKILSTGNSVVFHKCKGLMRQYLDRKYHGLLKLTNPITQELLGPDLEQKISDGARVVDAGKKLTFTPRACTCTLTGPDHQLSTQLHSHLIDRFLSMGVEIWDTVVWTANDSARTTGSPHGALGITNLNLATDKILLHPMEQGALGDTEIETSTDHGHAQ